MNKMPFLQNDREIASVPSVPSDVEGEISDAITFSDAINAVRKITATRSDAINAVRKANPVRKILEVIGRVGRVGRHFPANCKEKRLEVVPV